MNPELYCQQRHSAFCNHLLHSILIYTIHAIFDCIHQISNAQHPITTTYINVEIIDRMLHQTQIEISQDQHGVSAQKKCCKKHLLPMFTWTHLLLLLLIASRLDCLTKTIYIQVYSVLTRITSNDSKISKIQQNLDAFDLWIQSNR